MELKSARDLLQNKLHASKFFDSSQKKMAIVEVLAIVINEIEYLFKYWQAQKEANKAVD